MIALVWSNLLYPLIAVVVAALLCGVVVLRHRRPKSVEANMKAFNKGLRALAPESNGGKGSGTRPPPRRADPPRIVRQASAPSAASAPAHTDGGPVEAGDEVEADTG